jgi:hypothetical protein
LAGAGPTPSGMKMLSAVLLTSNTTLDRIYLRSQDAKTTLGNCRRRTMGLLQSVRFVYFPILKVIWKLKNSEATAGVRADDD